MLEQAADRFASQPYAWRKTDAGWTPKSFAQVRDESILIARALRSRGFNAGDKAVVLAEGSPEWITFELGVLTGGGTSVPLSIKLLAEELPFRVNHSDATVIGISGNQLPKLADVYGELDRHPLVVLLEDTDALLDEARSRFPKADVTSYGQLVAEGREASAEVANNIRTTMAELPEDAIATISYTSGTTGNPKGIMLTHRNYVANCTDAVEMFEVPYDYSTLLILPCDHSFAHTVGLYAALLRGIELYFVDARGGGVGILRNIPINMKETDPVFLLTVPALSGNFMKKIIAGVEAKGGFATRLFRAGINAGIRRSGDGYERAGLFTRTATWLPHTLAEMLVFRKVRETFGKRIRFFVGGGALLDRGQQDFFNAIGLPVYQGYGLTEAAPIISANTPREHKFGTSGKIAPTVTCRITRDDGTVASPGESGEICIQGDNVMAGYYKNDDATAETIKDGWLHTGDLGYMDPDGFLVVTGRAKALLISADGEKYSPEEIEETIATEADLVHQVMVYNDHRKYTSALITLDPQKIEALVKSEGVTTASELLDRIKRSFYSFENDGRRFPRQWVPAVFAILPEQFTEANRMINSTMKMVRYKITGAYTDDIEYLYTDEGGAIANPRNVERLAEMFGVEAR
jgi:long-chain acyl-CoA synthetase